MSSTSNRSFQVTYESLGFALFVATAGALVYRYQKRQELLTSTYAAGGAPPTSYADMVKRPASSDGLSLNSSPRGMHGLSAKLRGSHESLVSKVKRDKAKTFMEQQLEHIEELKHTKKDEQTKLAKGRLMEGAAIREIRIHDIATLRDSFPSVDCENKANNNMKYHKILDKDDYVLRDIVRKDDKGKGKGNKTTCEAFLRAGPRSLAHFQPNTVRAAIVTCGGLCPGLNNVVRELVHALHFLYGAEQVIGIRGGYHGFSADSGACFTPIDLTVESVDGIHHEGGTLLGSSRGGFDIDVIMRFLQENKIDQLYVIGGDGTHRGANTISETCIERKLNVSVVGIPKTIDNDVDLIDRSFGFTTSVEHAQAAIQSAKTEARCNMPNGIGIVKLMGRSAGFIAVHSTMASGDVDLCLVPEIALELEGPSGCLPFLMNRVRENGHAVVVVAEGAGEEILGKSAETDSSGNKKLPAIGEFLKKRIVEYFKNNGMDATVKYIDPSYMIRSVPANASDSLYCMLLAQNAVHGCMAGYTAFSVGLVNNRVVYIPIPLLVASSPRVMDPKGRTWERVLAMTRQPNTRPTMDFDAVNDRTAC